MNRIELPFHAKTRALRETARAVASEFSEEYWDAADQEHRYPEEFRMAFTQAGFTGIPVPESLGGGGGSLADLAAVLEETAAAGGGLNACSSVHIPLLCVPTLLKFGTDEQQREWLPKIAAGELFVTFGVTEPDAGTETTRITTAATPVASGYRITGTKVWNSGALRGDMVLLLARTSPRPERGPRGDGLTLLMVDLDDPAIRIKKIPKIGRNAVASCELFFEGAEVPADRVVGEVDRGFYHLMDSLNGERLLLAAEALGMGRYALQRAIRYANERVVFERPIGQNQAVQHPLAQSYLHLLAASEVVDRALEAFVGGVPQSEVGVLANAAKFLATEAGFECTNNAMQTFGGYSFAREYHIGRYWIESRLQLIAPVNNQMILNYIAERELGLPRSY